MNCYSCGGLVEWIGLTSNDTRTQCRCCGMFDSQLPEEVDEDEEEKCYYCGQDSCDCDML